MPFVPDSMQIRKAAFGRTKLFLPSTSTLHREVRCHGSITRTDCASVYHVLPPAFAIGEVSCWHCCEPMPESTTVVPIPKLYDRAENVYHCFGACCSPACCKAYVIENTSFDRGQQLNVLTRMLREVYGVTSVVKESPPRAALKRFGGFLEANSDAPSVVCKIVCPPFVSYSMIVDEHAAASVPEQHEKEASIPLPVEDADNLEEPPPPGLFTDFVEANIGKIEKDEPAASKRKRTAPAETTPLQVKGPMAKFRKET